MPRPGIHACRRVTPLPVRDGARPLRRRLATHETSPASRTMRGRGWVERLERDLPVSTEVRSLDDPQSKRAVCRAPGEGGGA